MVIKEYSNNNFEELCSLIKEHGKIARREITDLSFESFETGLTSPKIKTFCYFINGTMNSFIISNMLDDHPSWFFRLMCAKKSNFYNPKTNGICALHDATISYWESRGITSYIYAQPYSFMIYSNSKIREGSPKLQEYTSTEYQIVPANTQSEYAFIRKIMKNKVFPEDMIVRWCFKNEK